MLYQIKSAFAGDEFSLGKKEKTSHIEMMRNAVLAINGAAAGFNNLREIFQMRVIVKGS